MLETAHDQATGLRRMFEQAGPTMFSIVGAAGTTAITMELARALSHAGRRVLILDRTEGEAAAALGLRARFELAHVLAGKLRLNDVIADDGPRVSVVPSTRALRAIDAGDAAMRNALARLLDASRDRFDLCLVNGLAPAGESNSARDVLLVTAATRASITDAYGRIKSLAPHRTRYRLRIVVNRAPSLDSAHTIYTSLAQTARRFLAAQLDFCAYLPPAETSARSHALARLAAGLVAESAAPYAVN